MGSGTLQKQLFSFNFLHGDYQLNIIRYLYSPQPLNPDSITTVCFSKESRICACSIADTEIQKQRSPATLLLPAAVIVFILFPLLFVNKADRRRSRLVYLRRLLFEINGPNHPSCRHFSKQKSDAGSGNGISHKEVP